MFETLLAWHSTALKLLPDRNYLHNLATQRHIIILMRWPWKTKCFADLRTMLFENIKLAWLRTRGSMYVCMRVYIWRCVRVHVHCACVCACTCVRLCSMCAHMFMCAPARGRMCACVLAWLRAFVRACVRACVRVCVCACVRACVRSLLRECVRACLCVYLYCPVPK